MTTHEQTNDPFGFENGGEPRESGELWPNRSTAINDGLMGKVSAFKQVGKGNDAYHVATFAPCVVVSGVKREGFAAVSVVISATLKGRVSEKDSGNILSLVYKGTQKGSSVNPFKLFDVRTQEPARLEAALKAVGAPADMIESVGLPF
jgi:hypothetical protein